MMTSKRSCLVASAASAALLLSAGPRAALAMNGNKDCRHGRDVAGADGTCLARYPGGLLEAHHGGAETQFGGDDPATMELKQGDMVYILQHYSDTDYSSTKEVLEAYSCPVDKVKAGIAKSYVVSSTSTSGVTGVQEQFQADAEELCELPRNLLRFSSRKLEPCSVDWEEKKDKLGVQLDGFKRWAPTKAVVVFRETVEGSEKKTYPSTIIEAPDQNSLTECGDSVLESFAHSCPGTRYLLWDSKNGDLGVVTPFNAFIAEKKTNGAKVSFKTNGEDVETTTFETQCKAIAYCNKNIAETKQPAEESKVLTGEIAKAGETDLKTVAQCIVGEKGGAVGLWNFVESGLFNFAETTKETTE